MLREAGLNSVAPRSFLHEFASPLEEYQTEYLEAWLRSWLNDPARKQLLATQDAYTLEQLLNPASPHYVFDRDDLHGILVDTMYAGSMLEWMYIPTVNGSSATSLTRDVIH